MTYRIEKKTEHQWEPIPGEYATSVAACDAMEAMENQGLTNLRVRGVEAVRVSETIMVPMGDGSMSDAIRVDSLGEGGLWLSVQVRGGQVYTGMGRDEAIQLYVAIGRILDAK